MDKKGNNILHICAVHQECIPEIGKEQIRELVNALNEEGNACFHLMALNGLTHLLEQLQNIGYNKALKTKDGKSVDDLLQDFEREEKKEIEEVVQELKEKEALKEKEKEKKEELKKKIQASQPKKRRFRRFFVKNAQGYLFLFCLFVFIFSKVKTWSKRKKLMKTRLKMKVINKLLLIITMTTSTTTIIIIIKG